MEITTANQLLVISSFIAGLSIGFCFTVLYYKMFYYTVNQDTIRRERIQEQIDTFRLGRKSINEIEEILNKGYENLQENEQETQKENI